MISYRVALPAPERHHYQLSLELVPENPRCTVSLPVWIPGSYMVREFGRHIRGLVARQGGQDLNVRQIDKTTWQVDCEAGQPLTWSYQVYAFDASVRTAFLDGQRGFFNATSLCLRVDGQAHVPHRLSIDALPATWDCVTALTPESGGEPGAFVAADYDELADHPVELGPFWRGSFQACGVLHEFVVAGAWPSFDGERLLADAQRICAAQIAFWHGGERPPFQRYVFMLNAVEDGYGGLEHRASTALICKRADLPRQGQAELGEGYLTLLGLISHEYFHTWNVKRLKPSEFLSYDYSRENYSELLWFFEGFTSYYDDLMLLRSGVIDAPRYLKLLAQTAQRVAEMPGRRVQSVAQASFDAWVKYYRVDENTANATVSYYTKGALVALLLDLNLRQCGQSLDALMRRLWAVCPNGALTEVLLLEQVSELAGAELASSLRGWVHGLGELPLDTTLAAAGVRQQTETNAWAVSLGLRLDESGGSVRVKAVLDDSPAAAAGLSAGDELLAVNGWRLRRWEDARQWVPAGQALRCLLARQQRILECVLVPDAGGELTRRVLWSLDDSVQPQALALRQAWLGA